jgi:hypothetical protein
MTGICVGKTLICSESTTNPNEVGIEERSPKRLKGTKFLVCKTH